MNVSYNWLQTFFDTPLPPPTELESLLTFHSAEIDAVTTHGDDTVLDVKVLPDKSAWLMSQRGVAKEVATILGLSLSRDPLAEPRAVLPETSLLAVTTSTPTCDYYSAALMHDVTVGPSPAWLQQRLATIGQRSINNVVDATNYVMFELGQPLHAFDADKLGQIDGQCQVGVRAARDGETITVLTGESYTLAVSDAVIVDRVTDVPIGIAGVKGGQLAAVDAGTTRIVIEAAHFDRFAVRTTSKQLRLRTDASARYENGVSVGIVPYGLTAAVALITDIASGVLVGQQTIGSSLVVRPDVECTLAHLNSVLGLRLTESEVMTVLDRFDYVSTIIDGRITVTPPFERDDLVLAEDLIEEIGRIYGLEHIIGIPPERLPLTALNARHYYAELIRQTLQRLGFSEILTSSFRAVDEVQIKNALASDKSYLRSQLHENIITAVSKNIPHRDLLGLSAVKVFEIGTVFNSVGEAVHVGLGVQTGSAYKAKVDDPVVAEAQRAIEVALGRPLTWVATEGGVSEFSLDAVLPQLPVPTVYAPVLTQVLSTYLPFSLYPSVTRDIALWVPVEIESDSVSALLRSAAGTLCVRITLFDTFIKDERTSLGFRLVFQSQQKTLEASEVDAHMSAVYDAATKAGWEVR